MKKKLNSKHRIFNLDESVSASITEAAKLNGMSRSSFIEFLTNSWEETIDPSKKLNRIRLEKKVLQKSLIKIEEEENHLVDLLQRKNEWSKKRQEIKPKIIRNLMRIISEGRHNDAEIVARSQAIALGIPAITLLTEALGNLEDGR